MNIEAGSAGHTPPSGWSGRSRLDRELESNESCFWAILAIFDQRTMTQLCPICRFFLFFLISPSLRRSIFHLTWVLAASSLATCSVPNAVAQQPTQFPWGGQTNVYRVLTPTESSKKHAPKYPIQLESLPVKPGYAYGWFGRNPTPAWGRHFGYSKNYTQWTRR